MFRRFVFRNCWLLALSWLRSCRIPPSLKIFQCLEQRCPISLSFPSGGWESFPKEWGLQPPSRTTFPQPFSCWRNTLALERMPFWHFPTDTSP
ncbi:hypothetical protein [Mandarin fish ranavirus]|nr:hypothetical protein [Mandarin fish ranavirus]